VFEWLVFEWLYWRDRAALITREGRRADNVIDRYHETEVNLRLLAPEAVARVIDEVDAMFTYAVPDSGLRSGTLPESGARRERGTSAGAGTRAFNTPCLSR